MEPSFAYDEKPPNEIKRCRRIETKFIYDNFSNSIMMKNSMKKMDSTLGAICEDHFDTMLRRVAYRRALSHEMAWLFDSSNTLPVIPDYFELRLAGRNTVERFLNQLCYRFFENLWFGLFWTRISGIVMDYTRNNYFPMFFQQSEQTPQIEASQKEALGILTDFLNRRWKGLGLCTFNEVGILINEVLKSCYQRLDCPEDLFAGEKDRQNQAVLRMLKKYTSDLAEYPDPLEILVYGSCQSNWIDSVEGDGSKLFKAVEADFPRMISDPGKLKDMGENNPHYRMDQLKKLLSDGPKHILFECDNSGEVVFDLLLIQYLIEKGHQVILGAKARPAINDATVQDVAGLLEEDIFKPLAAAKDEGRLSLLPIDSVTGGKLLYEVSDAYKNAYQKADFLILKGQANFQSMPMGIPRPGGFVPYKYRKPMVIFMPVKSVMSRICLNAIFSTHLEDRSLFLYYYHPNDSETYPK